MEDGKKITCESVKRGLQEAEVIDKRKLAFGAGAFIGSSVLAVAGDAAGLVSGLSEVSGGVLYDAGAVIVAAASAVWVIRKILSLI